MKKQAILPLFFVVAAFLAVGASAVFVFAQDNSNPQSGLGMTRQASVYYTMASSTVNHDMEQNKGSGPTAPGLTINGSGSVMIQNAKITNVSGQNATVGIFGIPLTIMTSASTTQIIGVADFAHIVVGDMVSVKGTIDQTSGVITAIQIRDTSQQQQLISSLQQQIQALLEQIKKLQGQIRGL